MKIDNIINLPSESSEKDEKGNKIPPQEKQKREREKILKERLIMLGLREPD